ncbi:MAG: hypothetical protein ABIX01_09350, partial [Chitinophagaceae bacterium]
MKKRLAQLVLFCQLPLVLLAQLKSGPMLGHVDFRTATIWVEHADRLGSASVKCWPKGGDGKQAILAIPQETNFEKNRYAFTQTYTFTN